MKILSSILTVIGFLLLIFGMGMPTSVLGSETFGRVNNIGLLQTQTLLIHAALASLLGAILSAGFGTVADVLRGGDSVVEAQPFRVSRLMIGTLILFVLVMVYLAWFG